MGSIPTRHLCAYNDGLDRWCGSIAMNANGDIALGYSVASLDVHPSIRVVGQTADASGSGTMNVPELRIYDGEFSSAGTSRWGDYAMMSTDPSDNDFWFTTEYVAVNQPFSGWGTKITEFVLDEAPAALCRNISLSLNEEGIATISPEDLYDGDANGLSLSINKNTFDCNNVGDNEVVLTVENTAGIQASCTAIVTIADTTAPFALCKNYTLSLAEDGTATLSADQIDNGSFDACSALTYSLSKTNFTLFDLGENEVELTITDAYGNTNQCTALVNVVNNRPIVETNLDRIRVTLGAIQEKQKQFQLLNQGDLGLNYQLSLTEDLLSLDFPTLVTTYNQAQNVSTITSAKSAVINSPWFLLLLKIKRHLRYQETYMPPILKIFSSAIFKPNRGGLQETQLSGRFLMKILIRVTITYVLNLTMLMFQAVL